MGYSNAFNVSTVAPLNVGQSFTAECNGDLESLQIYATENGTVTSNILKIYEGNTVSGDPIYSKVYPDIIINEIGEPMTFNISDNLPLIMNNQYTFQIDTNLNIYYDSTGNYAGGVTLVNENEESTLDLNFTVNIEDSSLSIPDLKLERVTIYPNPATEFITITNPIKNDNFKIFDIGGSEVLNDIVQNQAINIKQLKSGIYFLKIDGRFTVKFIKK